MISERPLNAAELSEFERYRKLGIEVLGAAPDRSLVIYAPQFIHDCLHNPRIDCIDMLACHDRLFVNIQRAKTVVSLRMPTSIDAPGEQEIPERFLSDAWWRASIKTMEPTR